MTVVQATPEEKTAASLGLLSAFSRLGGLRARLLDAYNFLHGVGLYNERPATGERAESLRVERDKLETEILEAREEHEALVTYLRSQGGVS